MGNGFLIFDFRRRINLGRGVFYYNSLWSAFTGCPIIGRMIENFQNLYGLPRLFLLRFNCFPGIIVYGIVEQRMIRCPLCGCITRWDP